MLVYIVVLNLFVEFNDAIVIESFWISILTSVLLVALLDVVVAFEDRVHGYFRAKDGAVFRAIGAIAMFVILFTSKLLILEIVNFVSWRPGRVGPLQRCAHTDRHDDGGAGDRREDLRGL
ncbi:MAG: hypothetical protein GWP12_03205 [Nitrospirae bacterium]|nr:hypothetical protein [Nitrospirota bacterium]